jgi:hypothetical protein
MNNYIQPKDISVLCAKVQTSPKTIACVIATTVRLPPRGKERIILGFNKKNKTTEK